MKKINKNLYLIFWEVSRNREPLLEIKGNELPHPFGTLSVIMPLLNIQKENKQVYTPNLNTARNRDGSLYNGNEEQQTELIGLVEGPYIKTFIDSVLTKGNPPYETYVDIKRYMGGKKYRFGRLAENERHKGWRATHPLYRYEDD